MDRYVGARYMPKFMQAPHDPTQSYEALSVVDNGMGTSYVSNIPVPVGIPLSDTHYWAIYGVSSGAILNLQQQVNQLKDIAVTPEMYGAVGDGFTDDTAAIQSAVNDSKVVYMENSYLVTSGIVVPAGVRIFGTGNIVVNDYIYTFTLAGNNIIEGLSFTDNTALENEWAHLYAYEAENIIVKNCKFDTIGLGYAILMDHSTRLQIIDNIIENYAFGGIMLMHTCSYADIINNRVYNSRWRGADHNYPISISGYTDHDFGPAHHIRCNHNYIEELSPWWEGIDSHGCNDYEIIGNTIKNVYRGISMGYKRTGSTGFTYSNCNAIIKGNDITVGMPVDSTYETSMGVYVASGDSTATHNLKIANNSIKGTTRTTDNNEGTAAISVSLGDGSGDDISITDNYTDVSNFTSIGFGARGKLNGLRITGNYFNQIAGTSTIKYGIYLAQTRDYTNIDISNNSCNPNIVNDNTKSRFMRGIASNFPPADDAIGNYSNNNSHGLDLDSMDWFTSVRSVLGVNTKTHGVAGQIIPSSASGVALWACIATGSWLEVAGTSV